MAHLARSPYSLRSWRHVLPESSTPIQLRSISTNGARCLTTQGSSWSVMGKSTGRPLPRPLPICGARPVAWLPVHPGVRFRPGFVARISRVEDLVHAEDLWHGPAWRSHRRDLRAGEVPGASHCGRAGLGAHGARTAQYRVLSGSSRIAG